MHVPVAGIRSKRSCRCICVWKHWHMRRSDPISIGVHETEKRKIWERRSGKFLPHQPNKSHGCSRDTPGQTWHCLEIEVPFFSFSGIPELPGSTRACENPCQRDNSRANHQSRNFAHAFTNWLHSVSPGRVWLDLVSQAETCVRQISKRRVLLHCARPQRPKSSVFIIRRLVRNRGEVYEPCTSWFMTDMS